MSSFLLSLQLSNVSPLFCSLSYTHEVSPTWLSQHGLIKKNIYICKCEKYPTFVLTEFTQTLGLLFYPVLMFLVLSKDRLQMKNNSSCAIPCSNVMIQEAFLTHSARPRLRWPKLLILAESGASGRRERTHSC